MELTDAEREQLERWARRPKSAQSLAQRSRIVLACGQGQTNQAVAARERVTAQTVGKWRRRFVEARLDGLVDEPRPGRPRTITDDQVEAVIVRTLEETPKNATHWSTRSMAQASGLTQTAVSQIWRAFGLQPHRVESFKLSKDPLFVDKVKDVVARVRATDRNAPVATGRSSAPPVELSRPDGCGVGHSDAELSRLSASLPRLRRWVSTVALF